MHASRLILARYAPVMVRSNRFFEGDETLGGGGGDDTIVSGGGADTLSGGGGQNKVKVFDQAAVDRIVKERLRKSNAEREELIGQLSSLQQQGLTPENLEALQSRIETLQNEGKTKEQLAAEERGKLEKKLTGEIGKKDAEVKLWKSKYETFRSQTEILTAAGAAKAHNSAQIYNILRPDTVMEEEVGEDGKPTGEYIPKVNFRDKDKDGKPVVLKLSVAEAIKRMTEMEEHMNLFDSGGTAGLGGRNNGRSGGAGGTAVPTETSAYMAARKKNPNLIREGVKS